MVVLSIQAMRRELPRKDLHDVRIDPDRHTPHREDEADSKR